MTMAPKHNASTPLIALLTLLLSACAGSSVVESSAPPRQNIVRPPLTLPDPVVTLVPPVQTATPASPTALGSGEVLLPLMLTSVDAKFAGDAATTGAGATLRLDWATDRAALTVNNPVSDGSVVVLVLGRLAPGANLDYTRYGTWWIAPTPFGSLENGAAWLGGYDTAPSGIPATGSATYTGWTSGHIHEPRFHETGTVGGRVALTADFAARAISGAMTELHTMFEMQMPGTIADIGFTATLDPARNLFSGTTHLKPQPGEGTWFAPNATGAISGRFFGPAVNEVGGVWTLSDGGLSAIGAFGAKQ
jgi:hypothetical protein